MEPEQVFNLYDFSLEDLVQLLSHQQPWWVYLVVALIPLSLTLVAREIFCWFWKLNKIANRLERIEALLRASLEESKVAAPPRPAPRPVAPSAPVNPTRTPVPVKPTTTPQGD